MLDHTHTFTLTHPLSQYTHTGLSFHSHTHSHYTHTLFTIKNMHTHTHMVACQRAGARVRARAHGHSCCQQWCHNLPTASWPSRNRSITRLQKCNHRIPHPRLCILVTKIFKIGHVKIFGKILHRLAPIKNPISKASVVRVSITWLQNCHHCIDRPRLCIVTLKVHLNHT